MLPLPGFAFALSANRVLFRWCVGGSLLVWPGSTVDCGFAWVCVCRIGMVGGPDTKSRNLLRSSVSAVARVARGVC
jgi:hypothetical protein